MRLHVGCSYLQSPSNKRPLGTAYFNGACFRRKLHSARPAHALYCLRASRHDRPMHFLAWVCDSFIYALKCKCTLVKFFFTSEPPLNHLPHSKAQKWGCFTFDFICARHPYLSPDSPTNLILVSISKHQISTEKP